MPTRKYIQPDEKVALKLTVAERTLVIEELSCLDQAIEQIIRDTPAAQPVMMILADLDVFGGYVAAEANHCENKSKTKKLDTVFEKIQSLLEKFTDEEPPSTIQIDDAVGNQLRTGMKGEKKSAKKENGKGKTKVASVQLLQFKITLVESRPPIWRRIQVQDCTLDKLHEHIQSAMGWTNSHLHDFQINGKRYCDPQLLDDGFDDVECFDSTKTMLSEILPATGKRFAFTYQYDFGDSWEHEVVFEGNPPIDLPVKYPVCVEGERACPPEDIGGIWGYPEFIKIIVNPKHPEHKYYLECCGGSFSPEQFDAVKATKAMKKGLPDWRKM